MSKHRSLSNALLTPEKLAFINGQDAADSGNTSDALSATQHTSPAADTAIEFPQRQREPVVPKTTSSGRTPAALIEPAASNVPTPANDDYLVAITTRLQARTADALRRAHLEQKLNRREPATQQEIIEVAVQNWLRKHAYLS